jgi:hypothetical protein
VAAIVGSALLAGAAPLQAGSRDATSAGLDPAVSGANTFPNTTIGVHVFDDQLPGSLTPGQLAFVVSHLDGTQKVPRSLANQLHAHRPGFRILQYRLGLGLGDRVPDGNCQPTGSYIQILDGNSWVREWPAKVDPQWFAKSPSGKRYFQCDWGWYLVNTDNASWRSWFASHVSSQIADTGADALFLDSVSVPNQFGSWKPAMNAYDPPLEHQWAKRIGSWLPWIQSRLGVPVIANAGAWVMTRDVTDYSGATGVMIEGFARPWDGLAEADWELQMDRALSLINKGRVVIGQTYPDLSDVDARMFDLASYLLIKGSHTYINLEMGMGPTWLPEYDVPLGPALDAVPARVEALAHGSVFVRRYRDATVVVNPGDSTATWHAPSSMDKLVPNGGGTVPSNGQVPASWKLQRVTAGTSVVLTARTAAILVPTN